MQTTIQPLTMRLGKREVDIFPYWIGLLVVGILFGLVGAYQVFANGLQVTGLSNQVPWGLWISIDLSAIALGGSAFTFGVLVYLFKIKRMEIVGKLSVILGFLGYSTAGMVLLFDLGQPLRFWHPIVFWQPHSLLWEITMCVVLYLTVLMAELLPIVLEHPIFSTHPWLDRFPILRKLSNSLIWLAHRLHGWAPAFALIGMTLSLLHQASLGATYSVLSGRGLWFNQSAPVQFVLSAMGGGTSLLFFLSVVVFRIMRPGLVKDEVLYEVARIGGAIVLLCIYMRIWDWAVTNYYSFDIEVALQTEMLNSVTPYSTTFWVGQVLFALIPGLILIMAKRVRNFRILMLAAILPAFCTVLVRWNYNFSGLIASITYDPYTPTVVLNSYAPTWQEWAVASLVISYWLIGFSLAARFLPFRSAEHGHSEK
jgi:Ni/Fe-hydrogenase subunit HybB-like protein